MKSIEYRMKKVNGIIDIYFLGTNEWLDIWYHLQAWPNYKGLHSGWYKAYRREVSGILEAFAAIHDGSPVIVRGHSYGAVIAAMFGLELWQADYDIRKIELTGCPRFCTAMAAHYFKHLPVTNWRYGSDIVTTVPPWFFGPAWYHHVGPVRKWWQIIQRFEDHGRY